MPRSRSVPGFVGGLAAGFALLAFVLSRISFLSTMPRPLVDLYLPVSGDELALAPDGNTLAYVRYHGADSWVELRRLDGGRIRRLAGTKGAKSLRFSHDGRYLALLAPGGLRRVSLDSAEVESEVVAAPEDIEDTCYREDGSILAGSRAGLFLTSRAGRTVELFRGCVHSLTAIHGSEWVVYEACDEGRAGLEVFSLANVARRELLPSASMPRFLPPAHLLFLRNSAIWVSGFDPSTAELQGGLAAVVRGVDWFDVSANGTLAFRSPAGPRPVVRIVLNWSEELKRLGAGR